MSKLSAAVCAIVLLSQTLAPSVIAADRLAIVIGNGSYRHAPLPNPLRDADAVATAAQDLGFKTRLVKDADLRKMRDSVSSMIASAGDAEIVLFFYAGHGVQSDGINYLLPIDYAAQSAEMLIDQSISVSKIISWIDEADIQTALIFLDACRDNPFVDQGMFPPGLAFVEDSGNELLISYAAAAGAVAYDGPGPHSPYTTALVEALRVGGADVYEIVRSVRGRVRQITDGRQVPWASGSVEREIILKADEAEPEVEPAVFRSTDPNWLDDTAWHTIWDASNPTYFRDFVSDFPSSRYVEEAVDRMKGLTSQGMRSIPASYTMSIKELEVLEDSPDLMDPLAADITKCDLFAGSDLDPHRIVPGVPIHAVDSREAVLACTRDLLDQPGNPRLIYQLARSLAAAERWQEALHYAELAAEHEYPEAFALMANMNGHGWGIPRNPDRAIALWRAGVRHGSPNARANLGRSYRDGFGVEISMADALYWLKLAAITGEKIAADDLGNLYLGANGIAADPLQAMTWYQVGAAFGSSNAMNNIGNMYKNGVGVERDVEAATYWYTRALEEGNRYAPFQLARLIMAEEPEFDMVEVLNLFLLAGDRGFAEAYAYAAKLYETGRRVDKTLNRAYYFYLLAAGGGFAGAKADAERVEAAMEPAEAAKAEAQATKWLERNGERFHALFYAR